MSLPIEFFLAVSCLVFTIGVSSYVLQKSFLRKLLSAGVMFTGLILAVVFASLSLSEMHGQALGVVLGLFFTGWVFLFLAAIVYMTKTTGHDNTNKLHILRG